MPDYVLHVAKALAMGFNISSGFQRFWQCVVVFLWVSKALTMCLSMCYSYKIWPRILIRDVYGFKGLAI